MQGMFGHLLSLCKINKFAADLLLALSLGASDCTCITLFPSCDTTRMPSPVYSCFCSLMPQALSSNSNQSEPGRMGLRADQLMQLRYGFCKFLHFLGPAAADNWACSMICMLGRTFVAQFIWSSAAFCCSECCQQRQPCYRLRQTVAGAKPKWQRSCPYCGSCALCHLTWHVMFTEYQNDCLQESKFADLPHPLEPLSCSVLCFAFGFLVKQPVALYNTLWLTAAPAWTPRGQQTVRV